MKSLGLFLLFGLFLESLVGAADPYAREALMPAGPFRGQPLDTREKRAVHWLGCYRFANFYHQGRFWVAQFEPGMVEDVIFQIEHWRNAGPAAHVQLRFRMKPGHEIQLKPQDGGSGSLVQLRDVILSAEATYAMGRPAVYSIWEGLNQHYGITARAVSLETKVRALKHERDFRVEQLRLNLTEAQKDKVFDSALHLSWRMGHDEMYDTLRNSCTTFAFDVLDDSMKYTGWRRWITNLDQVPILSRYYLFSRQLVFANGASRLPDLQEEISGKPWEQAPTCENGPEELSALGSVDPDRK